MHILTSYHLSTAEIATLSCVSRGMRAFANSEAIWRNLFVESTNINGTLTSWRGSWKQTVAAHSSPSQDHIPHLAQFSNPYGQPFYSDLLYLSHRLSLLPLDRFINEASSSSRITPIPREPATLSLHDFHTKYASHNTPVILERSHDDIPGLGMTIDDLSKRYPTQWVRAEALRTQVKTYADYARSCEKQHKAIDEARRSEQDEDQGQDAGPTSTPWYDPSAIPDESPYYLFDSELPLRMANEDNLWTVPNQIKHCPEDVYGVRPTSSSSSSSSLIEADLFSLLSTSRPDWRWIIAGPTRSGSNWHKDPNLTSAWNTPLSGKKYWMMLPPHVTPPGVFLSEDGAEITTPVSLIEWLNDFYAETQRLHGNKTHTGGDGLLMQGICGPGETVYVPSGWWHLVVNLSESVALTQNFVSLAELPQVLNFIKNKSDQISGFKFGHDGDEDAVHSHPDGDPRRQLYAVFMDKLKAYDEQLAQWASKRLTSIEEHDKQQQSNCVTSSSAAAPQKKKKANTEGAEATTWWEKVKSGQTKGQTNGREGGGGLAVSSWLDEEELDDVPW